MGRKKIAIERITNDRNRQVTLNKRRAGLFKKAYELSVLCDCDVALVIFDRKGNLYEYSSANINTLLDKARAAGSPTEAHNNKTMRDAIQRKSKSAGAGGAHNTSDDEDELPSMGSDAGTSSMHHLAPPAAAAAAAGPAHCAPLTPNTQRRYKEIDDAYARMVQGVVFPGAAGAAQATTTASATHAGAMLPPTSMPPAALPRADVGNKTRKRPGLQLHVPGSSKPFPTGVTPRQPNASTANALPSLSGLGGNLLSPSFLIPTPSIISPSFMGLAQSPWGAAVSGAPVSPAVLAHSAAGDLHMSNSLQMAVEAAFQQQQQQPPAAMHSLHPDTAFQLAAAHKMPRDADDVDDAARPDAEVKKRRTA